MMSAKGDAVSKGCAATLDAAKAVINRVLLVEKRDLTPTESLLALLVADQAVSNALANEQLELAWGVTRDGQVAKVS